ncbi:MAG TPA: DUF1993 domain-containing protein [Steroidobacteraceae bacterium]|nr:DUF1993 domain-containing protein [Steroidobacteraceae bacterium]
MALSLYDVSVPALIRGLTNLSAILEKAAAHAEAKKIDPLVLAQARLYPDMHPLTRQVQIACDTAKGAGARLAGIEVPKHEDNEVTLADLKHRVGKTLDFLKTIKADQVAGAESRSIEIKTPNRTLTFTGLTYLNGFVLPNFYFHASITYALLRHNGVDVGKSDFLGAV